MSLRALVAISCLILLGCQQGVKQEDNAEQAINQSSEANVPVKKNDKVKREEQWQVARIQYFELEGGFFGLITSDNKKYLPLNLPTEFQQHNAQVRFAGKVKPNMMTIQQWGTPIEIKKIELISKGKTREELTH